MQAVPGVIEAAMFGRAVHAVVEDADRAIHTLPALLAAQGIDCHGISVVRPSLEDVFVSLVRREGGAVVG
jgi:ABC-2 type transport system ATP-binding protein